MAPECWRRREGCRNPSQLCADNHSHDALARAAVSITCAQAVQGYRLAWRRGLQRGPGRPTRATERLECRPSSKHL